MSPAMIKMWISIAGMALMFLAIITIYWSRYKLTGVFRILTAFLAYLFMIVAGLTLLIVFIT
ncbi:DUF2768 domain-containing protein [Neobacillus cucumis]|uniref:DUF2768 domain-containing protein n=1 Tax=Neobacillus cucumis TaxID=1740721 RepID=UPI002E1C899C|nr:DUF2768 domain-containing protein [Neobacillus cucumis]